MHMHIYVYVYAWEGPNKHGIHELNRLMPAEG